jgi:hypothetical protein
MLPCPGWASGQGWRARALVAVIARPVSPAEFAVRFGLEPVDVEWLIGAYRRGMSDEKLKREIQVLGCSSGESERLLKVIAKETAALVG